MVKAIWNRKVLAESDRTIVVEGRTNKDAAWYYPEPKEAAKKIAGYIAFWRGVQVEK